MATFVVSLLILCYTLTSAVVLLDHFECVYTSGGTLETLLLISCPVG